VALYIAFCAVVTIIASIFMPDRTHVDLSKELDETAPAAAAVTA
jgi:hypothetical protein